MFDWIFTHGDCDGICSGALALSVSPGAKVFFTHPYGLAEDLQQVNSNKRVLVCDIALSEANLDRILKKFEEIAKNGSLTYIDHHPLPEEVKPEDIPGTVIHREDHSASELTYTFLEKKLDILMSRVAIYGAVADYLDNTPEIEELLRLWDKRTVYFETGILVQGIEGKKREYDFKREIVYQLSRNIPPSFNQKLLDHALEITRYEEKLLELVRKKVRVYGEIAYVLEVSPFLGKSAIYSMAVTGKLIGMAGERRRNMIDISVRTRSKILDLNKILRKVAVKLKGSGGGHKRAAGARIPEDKFEEFLDMLNEEITTTLDLQGS